MLGNSVILLEGTGAESKPLELAQCYTTTNGGGIMW